MTRLLASVVAVALAGPAMANGFMSWGKWDWLKPLEPSINHMGTSGQTVPAQSAPVTTLTNPTLEVSRSHSTPLSVTISNGVNVNVLPTYRLVTQTYAGRIAITHNLTKDECEARKDEALGVPHTDEEKAAAKMFRDDDTKARGLCTSDSALLCLAALGQGAYSVTATDIRHAECLDHAPGETK